MIMVIAVLNDFRGVHDPAETVSAGSFSLLNMKPYGKLLGERK
jgi:hypothetical protein